MSAVFRCASCGHTVQDSKDNVELIRDIKDWVNYILRTRRNKGFTATFINEKGVPCPQCGERKQWQNA